MSLLRRKRRQNRLNQTLSPATRETRFSLAPVEPVRGLRNFITGRRVVRPVEHKRPENVIELPHNPFRIDFKRDLNQALAIQEQQKRQLRVLKVRKPLYQIQLDRSVRVDLPPEHPICRKREERRMLMFATGKAGKGGQKPRQQNNDIKIRCEK